MSLLFWGFTFLFLLFWICTLCRNLAENLCKKTVVHCFLIWQYIVVILRRQILLALTNYRHQFEKYIPVTTIVTHILVFTTFGRILHFERSECFFSLAIVSFFPNRNATCYFSNLNSHCFTLNVDECIPDQ